MASYMRSNSIMDWKKNVNGKWKNLEFRIYPPCGRSVMSKYIRLRHNITVTSRADEHKAGYRVWLQVTKALEGIDGGADGLGGRLLRGIIYPIQEKFIDKQIIIN